MHFAHCIFHCNFLHCISSFLIFYYDFCIEFFSIAFFALYCLHWIFCIVLFWLCCIFLHCIFCIVFCAFYFYILVFAFVFFALEFFALHLHITLFALQLFPLYFSHWNVFALQLQYTAYGCILVVIANSISVEP